VPGTQRPEKILLAMRDLSGGKLRPLKYKAFQLFPEDFALRGYPKYPDSSDIHKPLYGPLKRHGYVRANNKMFTLTEKGLSRAAELTSSSSGNPDHIDRVDQAELKRILESEAFQLFATGERDKLLDTDFFSCLGVTVRTPKNDFLGRLYVVEAAVDKGASLHSDPRYEVIRDLHSFLLHKFASIIGRMKGGRND
jgi:hypothetical protein